jgi:hypothetical protein
MKQGGAAHDKCQGAIGSGQIGQTTRIITPLFGEKCWKIFWRCLALSASTALSNPGVEENKILQKYEKCQNRRG